MRISHETGSWGRISLRAFYRRRNFLIDSPFFLDLAWNWCFSMVVSLWRLAKYGLQRTARRELKRQRERERGGENVEDSRHRSLRSEWESGSIGGTLAKWVKNDGDGRRDPVLLAKWRSCCRRGNATSGDLLFLIRELSSMFPKERAGLDPPGPVAVDLLNNVWRSFDEPTWPSVEKEHQKRAERLKRNNCALIIIPSLENRKEYVLSEIYKVYKRKKD